MANSVSDPIYSSEFGAAKRANIVCVEKIRGNRWQEEFVHVSIITGFSDLSDQGRLVLPFQLSPVFGIEQVIRYIITGFYILDFVP